MKATNLAMRYVRIPFFPVNVQLIIETRSADCFI